MKTFVYIFIIFLSVSNAHAQTYGPPIAYRGVADCGKWLKARSSGTAAYLETGVIGFINGTSYASGVDVWYGKGSMMSNEGAFLFIDNYCQKNPLDSMWEAAAELTNANTNNQVQNNLRKLLKK